MAGTGVSTTAVYAHLGGMGGFWRPLHQEGCTRLPTAFAEVPLTRDPVADLAAYMRNAVDHPDLYRAMLEADFDLTNLAAPDLALEQMVQLPHEAGRTVAWGSDALVAETQAWVLAHGLVSLMATGPCQLAAPG